MLDASIIIPFKSNIELLYSCINSIFAHTTLKSYEIILIDNNLIAQQFDGSIQDGINKKLILHKHINVPFNYSLLMNKAAHWANGEILVHLNSDVEILCNNWLDELFSLAERPNIGCVGSLLSYPDSTIQHAGVLINKKGHTRHLHKGLDLDQIRNNHRYEVAAVTGAVLAIRKKLYFYLGGMNEELSVAYNDIDLCMKARSRGFSNMCTSKSRFLHHESATRGRDASPVQRSRYIKEQNIFLTSWEEELKKMNAKKIGDYFNFLADCLTLKWLKKLF